MMKKIASVLFACSILIASHQAHAQNLCACLPEIKKLPFKGEKVDDAAYNALIEAGSSVVPCLITSITDATKMRDPRQAPTYSGTTVGDVAYFVLLDIIKVDFVELLPASVQQKYKSEGVYAYFEFVESKQNRKLLQRRLRDWYSKNAAQVSLKPLNSN